MYNIFRNSISIPSSIKIYILHLRDISYRKHEQICRDQPAENIVQPGKNSATRVMLYGVPQAFTRSNNFYIQSIDGRKNFGKITCIFRAIDAQNFRARNIFLRICGIKLAKKWGSCKWKERKREIIEDRSLPVRNGNTYYTVLPKTIVSFCCGSNVENWCLHYAAVSYQKTCSKREYFILAVIKKKKGQRIWRVEKPKKRMAKGDPNEA